MALMNQKGGVGKTTTAVNLAAGLAMLGRPTLLIDLDPQGHATLHLGAEVSPGQATAYDVLLDPAAAAGAIVESRPNLWLMPATVDLAAAEPELASAAGRDRRLQQALAPMRDRFEFVLIDCPPSLGLLTVNAVAAAREVVAPMQSQFLALQGLGKLLETVALVARGVNPRLRVSGVVLCAHEESTRLSREVVADLERFFAEARQSENPWRSARVFRPPVRRNVKLAEAPSFGKTIFEYAPSATGSADYRALAEGIAADWDSFRRRRSEPEVTVAGARAPAAL
jgi:chromosome partitioning protein